MKEKVNRSLEVANIFNENKHKRLSVLDITAIRTGIEAKKIVDMEPEIARKKLLNYTETFITHAKKIIEEDWGGVFLSKK